MPVIPFEDLPDHVPARARLLGLDFGDKTIGVAVSDRDRTVASTVETIRRTKFTKDAARLKEICEQRQVKALVLGLPVSLDGTEGPRCQATRQFARNLMDEAGLDLPIVLWDERLSTAAVERFLIGEADMRRDKRKDHVDKMAAAYILQGALDAMRRG